MSLRPAQELVAESSKFSLRSFFDKPTAAQSEPAPEGLPTLNVPPPEALPSSPVAQGGGFVRPATPNAAAVAVGPIPTTAPKESKFTFNGMMPTTTPIQMQHKMILQAQQAQLQSASTKAPPQQDANEIMRLKAQVLSLTDRTNQLTSNLASTSESVVKGNKALTSERAQFHAKYSSLTKKLEATQAALAEAEALPKEAIKNANLLNTKILELQEENEQLVQTRAELEKALSEKEVALGTDLEARCNELQEKYTTLAAQHSVLLDDKHQMAEKLDQHVEMLTAAHVQLEEANERVKASQAEIEAQTLCLEQAAQSLAESQESSEAFRAQIDASQLEIAQTDSLVDTLDAKLADLRVQHEQQQQAEPLAEVPEVAEVACCCPHTLRVEELEKVAHEAREKMHNADESCCAHLVEEARFHEAVAKRARACLEDGMMPERAMVAHVYTDEDDALEDVQPLLDRSIRSNRWPMGTPFDDTFLQCTVDVHCCAQQEARSTGAAAVATAEPVMDDRTSAFVKAVSEDLKFHMQDSQQLYKTSSTTGAALKL